MTVQGGVDRPRYRVGDPAVHHDRLIGACCADRLLELVHSSEQGFSVMPAGYLGEQSKADEQGSGLVARKAKWSLEGLGVDHVDAGIAAPELDVDQLVRAVAG